MDKGKHGLVYHAPLAPGEGLEVLPHPIWEKRAQNTHFFETKTGALPSVRPRASLPLFFLSLFPFPSMKDRNALDMGKIAGEFLIRYTQMVKE